MSTIIKLRCLDQVLTFESTPVVASGGLEEDFIQVEFCSKWDGLTKTAVFWRNEKDVYHVPLDETDSCAIPREVLVDEGVIYFGLFGVSSDGRQRTSEAMRYTIVKGAITSGTKPADPTPDIYTQLLAKYQGMLDLAGEIAAAEEAFEQAMTERQTGFEAAMTQSQAQHEAAVDADQAAFEQAQTEARQAFEQTMTAAQEAFEQDIQAQIAAGLLPDDSITTEKLKDGVVTAAKIAPGALLVNDETVALLGLQAPATVDGAFAALAASGSDVRNLVIEKVTESCNWKAPKAVGQAFKVLAVGGGGGGAAGSSDDDNPGGGGGGYVTIEELTIPEGTTVAVVCGAGGTSGTSSASGGTGGTTKFGSYLTAAGGKGGSPYGAGGDGGAGGGGGHGKGGNGGTYGGGGGGYSSGAGGNGGTYGGGGGGGRASGAGGTGGTYGGNGAAGADMSAAKQAEAGTQAGFSVWESLLKEMNTSGAAGAQTASSYIAGPGGGGYGGAGGKPNNYGAGGGGGYGGNGGNGGAGGGGGGNYGGNGGNAGYAAGGGGGGLFCRGANASSSSRYSGGGGGIVSPDETNDNTRRVGGSGGCYIMYFREV